MWEYLKPEWKHAHRTFVEGFSVPFFAKPSICTFWRYAMFCCLVQMWKFPLCGFFHKQKGLKMLISKKQWNLFPQSVRICMNVRNFPHTVWDFPQSRVEVLSNCKQFFTADFASHFFHVLPWSDCHFVKKLRSFHILPLHPTLKWVDCTNGMKNDIYINIRLELL